MRETLVERLASLLRVERQQEDERLGSQQGVGLHEELSG